MEIKTTKKLENVIVSLYGEIDQASTGHIREAIQTELMAEGVKNLILNLRYVTFMDSSGIGMILGRYKFLKNSGGKIILCDAGKDLMRILSVSGLTSIIPIFKNTEDALKYLKEEKINEL